MLHESTKIQSINLPKQGYFDIAHTTKGPFPANRAVERIPLKYMGPPAAADPLAVAARI